VVRTHVALANLSARPTLSVLDVMVEVAIRFTHRFAPADRDYTGASDKPHWHHEVMDAVAALQAAGFVAKHALALTETGGQRAGLVGWMVAARRRFSLGSVPDCTGGGRE
jgi:hypothetical protein